MKRGFLGFAVMSVALFCGGPGVFPAAAQQGEWIGNANLLLGTKALEKKYWEPADKQTEFGIETDFRKRNWPCSIALEFLRGSGGKTINDGFFGKVELKSVTTEFNMGVKKVWDNFERARVFIGGGVSLASAEASISGGGFSGSESRSGTGLWLGGGLYWLLGKSGNIGFEVKKSAVKIKSSGSETEAGGNHLGLLLGLHWGGAGAAPKEEYKPVRHIKEQRAVEEPQTENLRNDGGGTALEVEKQRLEIEKQKLQLERERLKFEREKAAYEEDN